MVLLKKVRRPATARLMSVLVGLRSSVVNRGNCTFSMSSGATFTYGTLCKHTVTIVRKCTQDGYICVQMAASVCWWNMKHEGAVGKVKHKFITLSLPLK